MTKRVRIRNALLTIWNRDYVTIVQTKLYSRLYNDNTYDFKTFIKENLHDN